MIKRLFDIVISSIFLVLLSPLYVVIHAVLWITMGSPVIFKQQRPGYRAEPFYIYKYRTMSNKLDGSGNLLPDTERLTRTGRILRKFSLDELPQLLNVLKGEMSIVGPRPLLMEYLKLYNEEQALRHEVRPGITGWAQVNGRNALSWEDKFRYDTWYVKNQNILLDFRIILLTILQVIRKKGINTPGRDDVEYFRGSSKADLDKK
ncbi:MAG TPA: sugar transferase [candidate division Zixibacteria bacterium]|nr:sugar transferase [candidate division Zixibacteria bacterium]